MNTNQKRVGIGVGVSALIVVSGIVGALFTGCVTEKSVQPQSPANPDAQFWATAESYELPALTRENEAIKGPAEELAHKTCEILDTGDVSAAELYVMIDQSPAPEVSGAIVYAGVTAYCPEYNNVVSSLEK